MPVALPGDPGRVTPQVAGHPGRPGDDGASGERVCRNRTRETTIGEVRVPAGGQAYVDAVQDMRPGGHRPPDAGRATVDRAVGLLAGRTRCRLAEAHRHLLRMAAAQNRDVADV